MAFSRIGHIKCATINPESERGKENAANQEVNRHKGYSVPKEIERVMRSKAHRDELPQETRSGREKENNSENDKCSYG